MCQTGEQVITDEKRGAWGNCHLWPNSLSDTHTHKYTISYAQIAHNYSYALTYSSCHFFSVCPPITPSSLLHVCGKHIHLTQTTNGTAVSSDWHPHHCRLTNHIATLACQGADSSDFHKGSSTLIVYVCVCEIQSDPGASGRRKL